MANTDTENRCRSGRTDLWTVNWGSWGRTVKGVAGVGQTFGHKTGVAQVGQ